MRAALMSDSTVVLLIALLSFLAGGIIGWLAHDGPVTAPEDTRPAPARRQPDGSLLARRAAPPSSPPPHALPRGSRERRRIAVTAQPAREDSPPLTLDLSLVEMDGGQRIVASSPHGEVLAALDMPIVPADLPAPPRGWAAGASVDLQRQHPGLWLDRDLGRFRVGVDLVMEEHGALQGRARLGFRF